jgi:hypothetical protein
MLRRTQSSAEKGLCGQSSHNHQVNGEQLEPAAVRPSIPSARTVGEAVVKRRRTGGLEGSAKQWPSRRAGKEYIAPRTGATPPCAGTRKGHRWSERTGSRSRIPSLAPRRRRRVPIVRQAGASLLCAGEGAQAKVSAIPALAALPMIFLPFLAFLPFLPFFFPLRMTQPQLPPPCGSALETK